MPGVLTVMLLRSNSDSILPPLIHPRINTGYSSASQTLNKWDRKSIKNAPHNLKQELGDLTRLKDNQVLFTRPAQDEAPALLAIWWPWGHGGTVSLRLTVLSETYLASEIRVPKERLLTLIKKLFN